HRSPMLGNFVALLVFLKFGWENPAGPAENDRSRVMHQNDNEPMRQITKSHTQVLSQVASTESAGTIGCFPKSVGMTPADNPLEAGADRVGGAGSVSSMGAGESIEPKRVDSALKS